MSEKIKKLIKLGARVVITTVLLIWVFSRIDLRQLLQTARRAEWELMLLTWVFALGSFWIQAIKMQIVLRQQGCQVRMMTIFGVSAITALYGMVLPGMLDTSVKWYILQKHTGKPSNILSSMVYNQLSITVLMVIFGLAALIVSSPIGGWQVPIICAALLVAMIIISLILLSRKTGLAVTGAFSRMLNPLPSKFRKTGQKILQQLSTFQTVGWAFHLRVLLYNAATAGAGVVVYVLAAQSAGITVPLTVLMWQSAIIYLLGRLPLFIANLGAREVTLVATLAQYAVAAPQALVMSMVILSGKIFMVIVGAIFQLSWSFRKS